MRIKQNLLRIGNSGLINRQVWLGNKLWDRLKLRKSSELSVNIVGLLGLDS